MRKGQQKLFQNTTLVSHAVNSSEVARTFSMIHNDKEERKDDANGTSVGKVG
jgi:hypothetical protein